MQQYLSIYRGKVLDNQDPKNLGRCKVLVPSIYGSKDITANLLPWSKPIASVSINEKSGNYCIPEVGDIVWVFYEGGDIDSPLHFGGTYGINDIKVENNKMMLYCHEGNLVYYDKSSKSFRVHVGTSDLTVNPSNVVIKSNNVVLQSDVSIQGNLSISGNLNIGGSCNKECDCE